MTVAQEDTIACVLDGKLFVMGGCSKDESKNWAEVFDTKTQTWESLPDPGVQLRCSPLDRIEVWEEKIYVISSKKNKNWYDVYNTREGRWEVVGGWPMFECSCVIESVRYYYCNDGCLWHNEKNGWSWRRVNGLFVLERHCRGASGKVEMVDYGGKLLTIWDRSVHETNIWCALGQVCA